MRKQLVFNVLNFQAIDCFDSTFAIPFYLQFTSFWEMKKTLKFKQKQIDFTLYEFKQLSTTLWKLSVNKLGNAYSWQNIHGNEGQLSELKCRDFCTKTVFPN